MTTTIYLDKKTKERAAKKAKKDNLSMSAVIRVLLSDYVDWKIAVRANWVRIDKVEEVPVTKEIQKKMDAVVRLWRDIEKKKKLKAKKL